MSSQDGGLSSLDMGATIRGFTSGQKLFGRYLLARILGRGGMGVVWLARDTKLERDVALKFLPELVVHDAAVLDGLKRETKRSLELTHHNIVRIHDFVEDEQTACISMEYVDGPTLSALRVQRENKVFEVDEVAPWIRQTCDALGYAHEKAKIVHRDLKPSNLMLTSKGDLKVADFGIARSLTDSVSMMTMAHGTSGTLVYMSPQQLSGARASPLDDIYALGATIYELFTSKPPFYSGNVDAQIREKTPMPMAARREELDIVRAAPIPAIWEEVVMECLAKDPLRRPPRAGEIAYRLGLLEYFTPSTPSGPPKDPPPLEIERESPPPPSLPPPSPPAKSKAPLIIALLAVLLPLLALAIGGAWWFGIERPRREAARQRQLASQQTNPPGDAEIAGQPEAAQPTPQPEGTTAARGQADAHPTPDETPVSGTPAPVSPYGTRLEFNGGELYFTSTVTEEEAKKLGEFLVKGKFFDGVKKTVQIRKNRGVYEFRMVTKKGLENDGHTLDVIRAFAGELSRDVFNGVETVVHLCDDQMKTLRVVTADAAPLMAAENKTYVNVKDKLHPGPAERFVAFSLEYPPSFTIQPNEDVFVKLQKMGGADGKTVVQTFVVGWYRPSGREAPSEVNRFLTEHTKRMCAALPGFRCKEVRKSSETVDGVEGRAILIQFNTADEKNTFVAARKMILVHPSRHKYGVAITLYGTLEDPGLKSADDLGSNDELARILQSFKFL